MDKIRTRFFKMEKVLKIFLWILSIVVVAYITYLGYQAGTLFCDKFGIPYDFTMTMDSTDARLSYAMISFIGSIILMATLATKVLEEFDKRYWHWVNTGKFRISKDIDY